METEPCKAGAIFRIDPMDTNVMRYAYDSYRFISPQSLNLALQNFCDVTKVVQITKSWITGIAFIFSISSAHCTSLNFLLFNRLMEHEWTNLWVMKLFVSFALPASLSSGVNTEFQALFVSCKKAITERSSLNQISFTPVCINWQKIAFKIYLIQFRIFSCLVKVR